MTTEKLSTGWAVGGSNPGGGEIFRIRSERLWGPHSLLTNGHGVSFPGIQWPGCGVNHPPPCSSKVKERVDQHFYSHSGCSWPPPGRNYVFMAIERELPGEPNKSRHET